MDCAYKRLLGQSVVEGVIGNIEPGETTLRAAYIQGKKPQGGGGGGGGVCVKGGGG